MKEEKTINKNVAAVIERNESWHGKPFIVKFYKDWVLMETIPYDSVDDIDFNYIRMILKI